MDKEEQMKILRSMSKEARYSTITNSIRCLDCTGMSNSIEYVESPIARDQREIIQHMLRKGYTDCEIYHEIGGIFGKHAIMELKVQDPYGSKELSQLRKKAFFIAASTVGVSFFVLRKLSKFVFRKR